MELRLNNRWKRIDARARKKHGVGFVDYAAQRLQQNGSLEEVADELATASDPLPVSTLYHQLRRHGLRIDRQVIVPND